MRPASCAAALPRRPVWLRRALGEATGHGVRVGLVDSGVDPAWRHPGFAPGVGLLARLPHRLALVESDDLDDRIGHGTACADVLLALAPEVEIHPIRVFHDRLETSVPVLVAALAWATEAGLDVVSLSLGTVLASAREPLWAICETARRRGTLVVAAADAASGTSYPAAFDNAIGVSAGDFPDVHDYLYRPHAAVECVAQGRRRVRVLGGRRVVAAATSYAAPHVAALAALLRQRRPGADLETLRGWLADHALGGPGRAAVPPAVAAPETPVRRDVEAEP